nr:peroxidase 11-like [Tanacetum cinerariifolium]
MDPLAIISDPPQNPNPVSVHSMVTRYRVGSNRHTQRLSLHVSSVSPLPKSYLDAFMIPTGKMLCLDVKNAFLHGDLSETVYMHQPLGFQDSVHPDYIIRSLHQELTMTDLGSLNYFLGISVKRDSPGIYLSQRKYAAEILERAHMINCIPNRTPVNTESKLGDDVQQVCLYMHDPREPHFSALKRILRYVRSTLDYQLQLFSSSTTDLVAYSNVDWASCPTARRSTSGYCVFFGNNLLFWSSKRQPTLSRSSAEAGYRGVANAVAETFPTISIYSPPYTMNIRQIFLTMFIDFLLLKILHASDPPLSLDYYKSTCPNAEAIVRKDMDCAVLSDPRNAAYILRLHFHDCFVQGCDGSVLLEDTVNFQGEKNAPTNLDALKGFDIIDRIKNKLESECPGTVSCADVLTIAARDATILVGGPYWHVPVGRKDSKSGSFAQVETNIPGANDGLLSMISKFMYQGLSITDMVALSGAHTIGMARCTNYRARIYGDYQITSIANPITKSNLKTLQSTCPAAGGGENNEAAMDYVSPNLFDNSYYHLLLNGEGLLNSDQELYSSVLGIETKKLVKKYAFDPIAFFEQFSESMVKLGNITNPETYVNGEVRKNCRFMNT